MLLTSWRALGEVALIAVLIYLLLVLMLRLTGKRTTSKMNNFDWIVTVAMGSMVSTVILVEDVLLLEGLVGIAVLVMLQFLVTWSAAHYPRFQGLVKATPRLLYYRGEYDRAAMRRERVTRAEIISAVRQKGYTSLEGVVAVVMETNAEFSIITGDEEGAPKTLETVEGSFDEVS